MSSFLDIIRAHATPIEVIFTIVALASEIVSIYALRDALIDSTVQAAAKINGPRRLVADNNIRQEQLRLSISSVMLMASCTFLVLEPPPPSYLVLPQSMVGLIAWIIVSLIIMISSLIDKSVRKKLQRYAPMEITTQSVTIPAPVAPGGGPVTTQEILQTSLETQAEASKVTPVDGGRRAYDKPSDSINLKEE